MEILRCRNSNKGLDHHWMVIILGNNNNKRVVKYRIKTWYKWWHKAVSLIKDQVFRIALRSKATIIESINFLTKRDYQKLMMLKDWVKRLL